jgi:hypothetical protein
VYPGTATERAGASVDFSGTQFGHEESVFITNDLGKVGQAHADGGGNFSTGSLSVPNTPGIYIYTFVGQNSGISGTSVITVTQ